MRRLLTTTSLIGALAKLRGMSVWALGYGDTPLWDAIRAELKTP